LQGIFYEGILFSMEEGQIGNYRILKRIGAGGMAKVYLAVHQDVPNLKVVLKVLSDPRMADRFRHEADKLALLDGNPNICRIKHFFNYGDDLVIAMEYIEGVTLEEEIQTRGRFEFKDALNIIMEVLAILETAHGKEIYHRDIKPSNIMIDKNSHVKIIDFGIAKGKSDPSLTLTGTSCGTPSYMAPEQFTPSENIDYARVDIYAVGTMLYYLITGELPFKGDNEFALRDAKLFEPPQNPRRLNPEISKKLDAFILKAIDKNPDDRFETVKEMRTELAALFQDEPIPVSKSTPTIAVKAEGPRKAKMVPMLIGIPLMAAVIVIVIIKVFFSGTDEKSFDAGHDGQSAMVAGDTSHAAYGTETVADERPPIGYLAISAEPYGDLYLDGALIGLNVSDTTLSRDAGLHVLTIQNAKADNRVIVDTVVIGPNENIQRNYAFEIPTPPQHRTDPAPAATGKVLVGSIPRGADIFIDGQRQPNQTPYTFTLETGKHEIKIIINTGGKNLVHIDTVNITKDGTEKVFFDAGG